MACSQVDGDGCHHVLESVPKTMLDWRYTIANGIMQRKNSGKASDGIPAEKFWNRK